MVDTIIKIFFILFSLLLLGCNEDDVSPKNSPIENSAPSEFNVTMLGVSYDQATLTWRPVYDLDRDLIYQTVYFENKIVLDRSTKDSIVTIRNLKPLTQYHGMVVATDEKHLPVEVPFSFTTKKYWLTFDRLYEGHEGNQPSPFSAALTSDGGYVIAAEALYGTKRGIYVLKIDSLGFEQWHTIHNGHFRGQNTDGIILQTADEGYIIAGRESLLKLDDKGDLEWQVIDQSVEQYYYLYNYCAVVQTEDLGFIVAGSLQKPSDSVNAIITKFTSAGQIEWQKEVATEAVTTIVSMTRSLDGNYVILGSSANNGTENRPLAVKISITGDVLWKEIYDNNGMIDFPAKVISSKDGGSVFISTVRDARSIGYAKIIKLDHMGEVTWEKIFQWNYYETAAYSIIEVNDGYVISGRNGDGRPATGLLFKINAVGDLTWKRDYGPTMYSDYSWQISDVFETEDKGLFLTGGKGFLYHPLGQENGLWLMKTDNEGNVFEK